MKKRLTFLMACLMMILSTQAKPIKQTTNKMDWWNEAKFGLFVHWGPYCLYGGVYDGYRQQHGGAEWIMNRCKIPVSEYRTMASRFNPVKFNAEDLVLMAKNAGMKYVVLTSKHHDGFAMFKSNASRFNIVDWTPFNRDVVDEVAKACKKYDMKFGLYYSHAQDWNNAGGATSRKLMTEGWANPDSAYIDNFTKEHHGAWDYRQLERSFEDYIHEVSIPQMKELLTRYKDLAVLWFDTPTNMNDQLAQEIHDLMKQYPQIITNDRLKRPNFPGDYKTPEGKVPKPEDVKGVYWETCMNIGSSWGFKSWENNWKSTDDIIRTLLMCAARGGNLLLNVGPDPMGIVPEPARNCLVGVGDWLKKYGEVLYGTQRSEMYPTWGECVRKDTKKNSMLYLCVYDWPKNGQLNLDGSFKVKQISMLKDGKKIGFKQSKNNLALNLNGFTPTEKVTIIKVELRNKLPEIKLQSNSEKFFDIADDK